MKTHVLWALAVAAGLWTGAASGCETPVHPYALQFWRAGLYEGYCFHGAETGGAEVAAGQALHAALRRTNCWANLRFRMVDVTDTNRLAWDFGLRDSVKRYGDGPVPGLWIVDAQGKELYRGVFGTGEVSRILDSPKRRELCERLVDSDGVLLFLGTGEEEEDADAWERVQEGVAGAKRWGFDVGIVRMRRGDEAELWFERQLALATSDPGAMGSTNGPLVFGVYGKGIVLPSLGADAITEMRLQSVVGFMNGPCTCEIKDGNPGRDLLLDWDWSGSLAGRAAAAGPGGGMGEADGLTWGFGEREDAGEPSRAADEAVEEGGRESLESGSQAGAGGNTAAVQAVDEQAVAPPPAVRGGEGIWRRAGWALMVVWGLLVLGGVLVARRRGRADW